MAEADELIVSQILTDLKSLMSLSESLSNFNWSRRKKRSSLHSPPPPPPPPPPPLIRPSPDTPLSFSPNQSHEKFKKRTREDYVVMIRELNQRNGFLQGEIQNVMKSYNKLKKFNSDLKAIKHEVLSSCTRKEGGGETQMEFHQHYRMNRHPPLIGDLTAERLPGVHGPIAASNGGCGVSQASGLVVGIDLNMPAEDVDTFQPLDVIADRRSRFAEARRKRRGMIRIKAMRNAFGIKLPINS